MRLAVLLCLLSAPVLACMREIEPTPAELFVRRATRQLSDRDYEGALKSARAIVAAEGKAPAGYSWAARMDTPTKPNVKAARRVVALALVRLSRHTEARPWLEKALAENPDDPQLNCRMAEVEIAEGKDRAALARLEPLALKDLLPDAPAHLALARARNATGDVAGARQEVVAALKQDPDSIGAKALRGVLDAAAAPQTTAQR